MFKTIEEIMNISDGHNPFNVGLIYGNGGLGYKPTLYNMVGGTIMHGHYVGLDKSELDKLSEDELRNTLRQNYDFQKMTENDEPNWVIDQINKETEYIENILENKERKELFKEQEDINNEKERKADEFREKKLKEKVVGGLKQNVDYQQNQILEEVEKISNQYKGLKNKDIVEPIYIGNILDNKIQNEKDLLNYLSNVNNDNYYNTKDVNPYYTSFVNNILHNKKDYSGKPMLENMLVDAISDSNLIEHKYRDKTYNEWKNQGYILINKEKIEGNQNFIPYYKKDNNEIKLSNIYYVEKKPKTWENGKPKDFTITKKEKTLVNDNNNYNWIFTTKTRELSFNPLQSDKIMFYEEDKPNVLLNKNQLKPNKEYRGIMNLQKDFFNNYKIPFDKLKKNIK